MDKDEQGKTELHYAARDSHVSEIVNLLLLHKANVDARDSYNRTPLHCAASSNRNSSHLNTIEILLKNEASVNAQDIYGSTPLHEIVGLADVETVKLLLKFGADVNVKDGAGEIPFFEAVRNENSEVIRLLIDHGSDVNCTNKKNTRTPLQWACSEGCMKIVKTLLWHGAHLDQLCFKDKTGYDRTLRFLLKYSSIHGCDLNQPTVTKLIENCENPWKFLVEHVAKLEILGIEVHPSIVDKFSIQGEHGYYEKCKYELFFAKNRKLENSWTTFLNLLVGTENKLKNYAGDEDFLNDFVDIECLTEFPIYGKCMVKNVTKAIKRRRIYDRSLKVLSEKLPIFGPNHVIVRDSLDCVTTNDLFTLCKWDE